MSYKNLSEFLSLLPERNQKNLVLTTAFFLHEVEKQGQFTSSQLSAKLKGHGRGTSKMNVSAVILSQCSGLVEPIATQPGQRERIWKLNAFGKKHILELLALPAQNADSLASKEIFYELADLHPVIQGASAKLFLDGHFDRAVETAFRAVNKYIRKKTGRSDDGGMQMMLKIFDRRNFSGTGDCLRVNPLSCESEENEQDGYRFIFAGVQQGVRNPFNHDGKEVTSPKVALEYLAFASHLVRIVEKAQPC